MHHGMDGDRTLQTVEDSYSQPLFSFPFSLPGRGFHGTVFTKEGAHEERMARVLEGRPGACGSGGQGKGQTDRMWSTCRAKMETCSESNPLEIKEISSVRCKQNFAQC